MKLETFFATFELFADAPNAVAKMRQFVLELAVRGKLVPQDPSDEPAHTSLPRLARVAVEAQDDLFPRHWLRVPLGNLGEWRGGGTPSKSRPDFWKGDMPWVSPKDMKTLRISDARDHISQGAIEGSSVRLIPEGSILIVVRGMILARAFPVALTEREVTINQDMKALIPSESRAAEFLLLALRAFEPDVLTAIERSSHGTCKLKTDVLEAIQIPIPPLAEQKRIVAKVDELMALCDRLEAQQQEREKRHAALARASLARFADAPTPANLELLFDKSYSIPPADLRKSILTLAVQGKLIRFEIEEDGEQTVGDHIEFQNGYAFKSEWFRPSGTRLCRNANVSHGVLDWRESAFVDDKIAREFERFALSDGDIVLSLDRPIIATGLKVARVTKADLPCLLLQRVAKPVPKHDQLDLSYFLVWLKSSEFVESIDPGRSNGVPHISTRQVQGLPFVLPPLAEQRRIVSKVDELMALVDQLENQQAVANTTSAALLEAVIHELLSPTAKIIRFPSAERDPLFDRAAIGCYAIERLRDRRTFGRTAQVKVLYMAEAHLGLDLGGRYMRDAAGPLDKWIYKFEEEAARQHWFSVVEGATKEGHKKIEYRKGTNLSAKAEEASSRLSAAQRSEFDRMLALLAQKLTVEVEIIATLFAAWNDFLIDGRQPNDDEIVREVRENWHPRKQRFSQAELRSWLAWLRQHELVPQGKGPHTLGQQGKLQLH